MPSDAVGGMRRPEITTILMVAAGVGCTFGAGFAFGAATLAMLLRPGNSGLANFLSRRLAALMGIQEGPSQPPEAPQEHHDNSQQHHQHHHEHHHDLHHKSPIWPEHGNPAILSGAQAPRPTHFLLRPEADPRLDRALFVRYDPPPERKTGAIIIVCPGGNYDECDVYCGEGQPVAQWLTKLGITGVVLQYRCVSQGHYWPAQFEDFKVCARRVKREARSWGCDPKKVGVLGFSAGGHLAGYAACKAPPEIAPKLQVLVYPSIDTETPREGGDIDPWYPDQGYPAPEESVHANVGPDAPPAFLAGIPSDDCCPAKENTDPYSEALKEHGIPVEYVQDDEHGHGCGLQDWWTEPCEEWLIKQGWARKQDA